MERNTPLNQLPKEIAKSIAMEKAVNIIKYQNFKTNAAMKKFNNLSVSQFTCGIAYVKRGVWHKNAVSRPLKAALDEALAKKIQPLTPSKSEARQFTKDYHTKKDTKLNIQELDILNKPITAKFEYGVRLNNDIKILDTEIEAKAFLEGLKFVGQNEAKLLQVEIKEI